MDEFRVNHVDLWMPVRRASGDIQRNAEHMNPKLKGDQDLRVQGAVLSQ